MGEVSESVFVSYAGQDRAWAEWVAWQLREAGHQVELDVWDWRTGDDFVVRMNDALRRATAVVALFSNNYFNRERWTHEEWTSVVARRERLIPVTIEPLTGTEIPATLAGIIRKDLHGLDEQAAVAALLDAVNGPTGPLSAPAYPGRPALVNDSVVGPDDRPRLPNSVRASKSQPHEGLRDQPLSRPTQEDYRLQAKTLGRGSYADVFQATHKGTGAVVALKRAHRRQDARDRIKREIEAQRQLAHPNVMPIRDHDPGSTWYTMPLATGTLATLREELDEEDLASILLDVASALSVAHGQSLIHRDISPHNILALQDSQDAPYRWVVADWGMVLPADAMSRALTKTGQGIGTPGFDAPELATNNARNRTAEATPAVDVYSLGRVAAWFLRKEYPVTGVPLMPDGEMLHWRPFVRATTQQDVQQRTQTMAELSALVPDVLAARSEPVEVKAERLITGIIEGNEANLAALLALAAAHQESPGLHFDCLALVPTQKLRGWVASAPEQAAELAARMARHLVESDWEDRDEQHVGMPLAFAHTILRALLESGQLGPAQDIAGAFFAADAHWNYPEQRRRTLEWLADLEQPADSVIAPILGRSQDLISYYKEPGWRPRSVVLSTIMS
jgi:serine/threonine-protein kinase